MKIYFKYCFFFIVVFLAGCKKSEIEHIPVLICHHEFVLSADAYGDNVFDDRFFSFNGIVTDAIDLHDGTNPARISPQLINLAYASNGFLTTPASNDAANWFTYSPPGYYDVGLWPVRNYGLFATTNLNENNFDTLIDITSVQSIALSGNMQSIALTPGSVYAFNENGVYGLIYVKSADGNGADIDMKYSQYW